MEQRLRELADASLEEKVYPSPLFPPSRYYRFLKLLALEIKPKLSVELGVCGGGGSLHLCYGSEKVIGVDFQYDHPEQIEHIKANFPNFEFLLSDSVEASKKIEGNIDLLFIDTDHTYERTLDEYNAYKPLLSDNAIVCFDDLFRPGMQEAWEQIEGNKIRLDFLHEGQYPEGGGFGIKF